VRRSSFPLRHPPSPSRTWCCVEISAFRGLPFRLRSAPHFRFLHLLSVFAGAGRFRVSIRHVVAVAVAVAVAHGHPRLDSDVDGGLVARGARMQLLSNARSPWDRLLCSNRIVADAAAAAAAAAAADDDYDYESRHSSRSALRKYRHNHLKHRRWNHPCLVSFLFPCPCSCPFLSTLPRCASCCCCDAFLTRPSAKYIISL